MTISLIINTYNRPDALAKVLSGIEHQTRWPDEILIADDGSEQETGRLIASWGAKSNVLVQHVWQPREEFRRTVILNKAIRAAKGDYIVFLDGDCVPHNRFIAD